MPAMPLPTRPRNSSPSAVGSPDEHGTEPLVRADLVAVAADDVATRSAGSGTSATRGCAGRGGSARTAACSRCPRGPAARRRRAASARRRTSAAPASADVVEAQAEQQLASLGQRAVAQVDAVEPQQVEGDQGDRVALGEPSRAAGVAHVQPVLQRPERRDPLPQRDDLAVEQEVLADVGERRAARGRQTVASFSLRDQIRRPRSVRSTSTRMPSHLTSWVQSDPVGTWSPLVASIGSTLGILAANAAS